MSLIYLDGSEAQKQPKTSSAGRYTPAKGGKRALPWDFAPVIEGRCYD